MPKGKSNETDRLIGDANKSVKKADQIATTAINDEKTVLKDIEMGEHVYGEYCPTDDYCENTTRLPGTLYQNFLAPPINWVSDTVYGILFPPLVDVKPSTPADIFKKFVFAVVKLLQVYMVLQIMQGVSIPDAAPTTGQFTYYIPYTIGASFLLQFLDFALSMFPKTGFHQIVCTFQTMLTTFILNLMTTPNWGPKGEYVEILQEVVKNQALINTLDFGLINALFPLPNCFQITLDAVDWLLQWIYDTIIKPVVNFFVFLFNWIVDWIIMPPVNLIILVIVTIYGWIVALCVAIWSGITYAATSTAGCVAWCCGATGDEICWCCGVVGDCCNSIGSFLYSVFTCQCFQGCSCDCSCDICNCFCCRKIQKTVKRANNKVAKVNVSKDSQGQYIEQIDFIYTEDSKGIESTHGSSDNAPETLELDAAEYIKKVAIFESKSKGVIGIHVTTNLTNRMFGTKSMDNEIYEYTCKKSEVGISDINFKTGTGTAGVGYLKNVVINKETTKPDGTKSESKETIILPPLNNKVDKANCLASCGL